MANNIILSLCLMTRFVDDVILLSNCQKTPNKSNQLIVSIHKINLTIHFAKTKLAQIVAS